MIKDNGNTISYGNTEMPGNFITKEKTEIASEIFKQLSKIVGEKEARQIINSYPAEDFINTEIHKTCGKTKFSPGDCMGLQVVTSVNYENFCDRVASTLLTIGPNYYTLNKLSEKICKKLLDKFLPKTWQFFFVEYYRLDSDIYIKAIKDAEYMYCSFENLRDKDFNAIEKRTDNYYKEYYCPSGKNYKKFYIDKKNIKGNLSIVQALIEHIENAEYKAYVQEAKIRKTKLLTKKIITIKSEMKENIKKIKNETAKKIKRIEIEISETNKKISNKKILEV